MAGAPPWVPVQWQGAREQGHNHLGHEGAGQEGDGEQGLVRAERVKFFQVGARGLDTLALTFPASLPGLYK